MSEKKGNGSVQLPVKIEVKSVKHLFTIEERDQLGADLAGAVGKLREIEFELDQIKSSYKAKTNEAEARINKLSTDRTAGWELRNERCRVHFFPEQRKKRFYLEADTEEKEALLEEDMTQDDYQQELILAESKFDRQEKIEIFTPTETDNGIIIVGLLGKLWYAAVRAKVGNQKLEERLDSEQPYSAKNRFDAITKAAKRFEKWLTETMSKDVKKGFEEPLEKALESHRERVD